MKTTTNFPKGTKVRFESGTFTVVSEFARAGAEAVRFNDGTFALVSELRDALNRGQIKIEKK